MPDSTKSAMFRAFVLYSTTVISGSIPYSSPLQYSFYTSACYRNHDISTTFYDPLVINGSLFATPTSRFLYSGSATELPNQQKNRPVCYSYCFKQTSAVFPCILHVSEKSRSGFCFRIAHCKANFYTLSRLSKPKQLLSQSSALNLLRASNFCLRSGSVFISVKPALTRPQK